VRIATRLFTPEVAAAAFRQRVLADSFAQLGYDVEVLTTTPPSGAVDDGGLRVSRWPALRDENGNIRGYLQYLSYDVPALLRLLVRGRPALLVAEPPPTTGLVVRLAAMAQRAPYAYYAADVWSDGAASVGAPGLLVKALHALESWVMRGAVVVLAVSDGVAERVSALGVPDERIVVVGNGVDTSVFRPDLADQHATEDPYFVYTGTMSEWQGADVFVRALATVRETHPTARMAFLGQGSELPALKALAERTVPGAVDFVGVVPPAEAARWLRGATAAIVSIKPGLGYDFAKPTKIYAATACGTPVVFAGVGAGRDLVESEGLGWAPGYADAEVTGALTAALDGTDRPVPEHLVGWTAEHASLSAAALQAAEVTLDKAGLRR
jgi:glycosyltransferase involved in cell wall biosynthesis